MNGCRYIWGQRRINQFPSVFTDAKVLPEQGLCRKPEPGNEKHSDTAPTGSKNP